MTRRRYRSYRYVTRLLQSDLFGDLERDLLKDAAEGMLLARSARSDEVEEMRASASAVLAELVLIGRINASVALEVQACIHDCGPADAVLAVA